MSAETPAYGWESVSTAWQFKSGANRFRCGNSRGNSVVREDKRPVYRLSGPRAHTCWVVAGLMHHADDADGSSF